MEQKTTKQLAYPLIVSDFDGTIVCKNGFVPQETKDTIAQFIKDGGIFVVSTGRMHYGILPQIRELGLNGLLACAHGTFIFDVQKNKKIFSAEIPTETAVLVCEKMEELDLHINIYTETDIYTNKVNERLRRYENAIRKKAIPVLDRPLSQYVKENGLCTQNILSFVLPEENVAIIEALSKYDFPGCLVTKSDETLVEVVNANFSKGTAIQFLANHFNIPIERTIGVGDQWNDLPMIETAGLGFAVKNANEKLKEKAIVLDYTNEESAVAKMIKQYAYK